MFGISDAQMVGPLTPPKALMVFSKDFCPNCCGAFRILYRSALSIENCFELCLHKKKIFKDSITDLGFILYTDLHIYI